MAVGSSNGDIYDTLGNRDFFFQENSEQDKDKHKIGNKRASASIQVPQNSGRFQLFFRSFLQDTLSVICTDMKYYKIHSENCRNFRPLSGDKSDKEKEQVSIFS